MLCNKTNRMQIWGNTPPESWRLKTYEPTEKEGERVLTQTKTAYIDTRYDTKIRIYNYLKKNGRI
jgi:hypothetical protein